MPLSPLVDKLLGQMSLEEKVGQVFIFTFVNHPQALLDLRLHPGGYVRIYSDALTVTGQHAELQSRAQIPLIVSADFERGIGSTISGPIDLVTNMCLGATGRPELAYDCGKAIAEEALAIGVNMNYVPVLDVNVNELNPIINTRSFGGNPDLVARMGAAFIRGTQDAGVIGCGKHFPGHGDTHVDSHTNLGTIDVSRERMEQVELVPFRAAIAAGVDFIMSAHLRIPAYDPDGLPATLSRRIMHDLLRTELGFEGATVSDALEMGGIARNYTPDQAIVMAINAGVDQLIMPLDNDRAVSILKAAVLDGRVSEQRLDEAVARILQAKERRGLLGPARVSPKPLEELLHTPEHYDTALRSALAGVTLLRDRTGLLPLKKETKVCFVAFSNFEDSRTYFLEPKTMGSHLATLGLNVTTVNCALLDERAVHEFGVIDRALECAALSDIIVVGAYIRVVINRGSVDLEDRYMQFMNQLQAVGKPVILVSFGNPYIIKSFPDIGCYVCGYGATEATQHATAMLLAGVEQFKGNLPVSISVAEPEPDLVQ